MQAIFAPLIYVDPHKGYMYIDTYACKKNFIYK